MGVIVGRHIEDITINPLEYVLDESMEYPVIFKNEIEAKEWLRKHGATDEYIYWLVFKEVIDKKCHRCGWPLVYSAVDGYDFTCPGCDEDFYRFEVGP